MLINGQYGHVQLFYEFYKENIIISQNFKTAYFYDERSALWVANDNKQIINLIPPFLQEKISQEIVINNIKTIKDREGRLKQIKRNAQLNNLLKQATAT